MPAKEQLWRNAFFYLSSVMAAFALVDLDAGRVAQAMGDAGVACLMLSLMTQFPVVRAIIDGASKSASREGLQREVQRLRNAHPWSERAARAGWSLFFGSLVLRAFGLD